MVDDEQHIQELLKILQGRLRVLERQAAAHGYLTPPHIITEIEDISQKMAQLKAQVRHSTALDNLNIPPSLDPVASTPFVEENVEMDTRFRYDAYISYVDRNPDAAWVWEMLVPKLKAANLRLAISGDIEELGVARVVNIERGLLQSKRTIVVLSPHYISDNLAHFEHTLALSMGIEEGQYRLLPIKISDIANSMLPPRLTMLNILDLTNPQRVDRAFERLIAALQGPLPHQ